MFNKFSFRILGFCTILYLCKLLILVNCDQPTILNGNNTNSSEKLKVDIRDKILTRSGICNKGFVYKITSVEDFQKYSTVLECLYYAGLTPSKVPEGTFVGSVIAFLNSKLINPIMRYIWLGKVITRINCNNDEKIYNGVNNVVYIPIAPFVCTMGPIKLNLSPGEYDDGKDVVILDYRKGLQDPCGTGKPVDNDAPINNIYPISHLVDVMRFVGKEQDGTNIFLGKSYLTNLDSGNYSTFLYYALTNKDPNVNADFNHGDSLPPLENTFSYTIAGI